MRPVVKRVRVRVSVSVSVSVRVSVRVSAMAIASALAFPTQSVLALLFVLLLCFGCILQLWVRVTVRMLRGASPDPSWSERDRACHDHHRLGQASIRG